MAQPLVAVGSNLPEDVKTEIWSGNLYWMMTGTTILPLATEAENIRWQSISAKMFSSEKKNKELDADLNILPLSLPTNLKMAFWYKECIRRIIAFYETTNRNNLKSNNHWKFVRLDLEESEHTKYAAELLKGKFNGIICNNDRFQHIVVKYNRRLNQFIGMIAVHLVSFKATFLNYLHCYFVVNYEILHNKELNDEKLEEAEKRAYAYKECHGRKRVMAQLGHIIDDPDKLKRHNLIALFSTLDDVDLYSNKIVKQPG